MRHPLSYPSALGLTVLLAACGSNPDADEKGSKAVPTPPSAAPTTPGEGACALAEEADTVLAWLLVEVKHNGASCHGSAAARIAAASKKNAATADGETPLVIIDEDGIWLWSASEAMPTIPHPPGSDHDFGALARSTASYMHEHPEQTGVRIWAAPEVAPADVLGLVETLQGPGCEATSKTTEPTPPGCLLWRPVILTDRPPPDPTGEAAPPPEPVPAGPPSNKPCGATFECPKGEECLGEKGSKQCRPATEADCKSYWRCETDGYCTLIDGRCLLGAETDADCKKPHGNRPGGGFNPCELLGACRAVGGDCVE